MKLEVGKEYKVCLRGHKLNQAKLNPEWIISEIKETETILEPDGKTIVQIISKNTKTSTVRLYVDNGVPESDSKVQKKVSKAPKKDSKPQKTIPYT